MLIMYQNTEILGTGTRYFFFNTKDGSGEPITLAGTPSLACNVEGGAAATAGLTLSVDHGGVTGRHRVAIDVDNATLALADGDVVDIYIAAGTVDTLSVVGTSVGQITISDGSLLSATQAAIRSALGLSAANLDTQLSTIDTNVDSVLADTGTDGVVVAAASKSGYSLAADQSGVTIGTVNAIATAAREAIADSLLGRAIAGGANTGRTVRQALRRLRNRVGLSGGTATVYAEDDTTPDWTAAVTTGSRDPVTDVDPA